MTTILAIETATPTYSVGVYRVDPLDADTGARAPLVTALAEAESSTSHHDDGLLPVIDQVIGQSGLQLADIDAIACGQGPGSFTGLRIGLATAKGLAYSTNKPFVTVCSLAALASSPTFGHSCIVACLDARKGEIFVGVFEVGGSFVVPRRLEGPLAIPPEGLGDVTWRLAMLTSDFPGAMATRVQLVGNVLGPYPLLKSHGEWHQATPSAKGVARLAAVRLFAQDTDDVVTSTPSYVRAPEIYPQPKQPLAGHLHNVAAGKKR